MQRMFKINGYFSVICFQALAMADALSEITEANFFGPIADKTLSISSLSTLAVWLTSDKLHNE